MSTSVQTVENSARAHRRTVGLIGGSIRDREDVKAIEEDLKDLGFYLNAHLYQILLPATRGSHKRVVDTVSGKVGKVHVCQLGTADPARAKLAKNWSVESCATMHDVTGSISRDAKGVFILPGAAGTADEFEDLVSRFPRHCVVVVNIGGYYDFLGQTGELSAKYGRDGDTGQRIEMVSNSADAMVAMGGDLFHRYGRVQLPAREDLGIPFATPK